MNQHPIHQPPTTSATVGRFADGAFYGLKVSIPSSTMHFHAWYRADGALSHAEGWDRARRCRPVRKDSAAWIELAARSDTIRDLASRTEVDHGGAY